MAAAKTKTKTVTKAKAKAPAKPKATKEQAKPQAAGDLLEEGTFVSFKGYRGEMEADEVVFTENDTLYIVEIDDEGEDGVLYSCIKAEDVSEYLENGADELEGGQVAPAEVKELKGGALDKAREAFMPLHLIGKMEELLDSADGDPVAAAVELNQSIQESYFYMGGALAMVLQKGSHLVENGGSYEGDEAFNDFCQGEFGFKASKGRNLARIYQTFSSLPDFDPASLSDIGWSIASKLEKYVTADNVDDVLETARSEDVTQRTVDAVMKEKFVSADGTSASGRATSRGGDKISVRTLSFRLSEDSGDTVDIALQQCMKQNGIESAELALERICLEWAQDHVETKTALTNIQRKAKKAARTREEAEKAKSGAAAPKGKASTAKAPAKRKPAAKK